MNIFERIQRPQTEIGKNIRDAAFFAAGSGVVTFLGAIDDIDFGDYDMIVASIVGFLIVALNRAIRK